VNAKVISKNDIAKWLGALAAKYEIIAPVTEDGVTRFKPVDDYSAIDLGPTPAKAGLREHFTPVTETLFEYTLSGQSAEVSDVEHPTRDRIIFGARACDAAALRYVDAVYSNAEPKDTLYFDRREHTALVGVFCNQPDWSCFCAEVGDFLTNPIEMDAYFTDIGDKYYAEALTPKGEELLSSPEFQAASDADKQAVEEIRKKALSRLPARADHEAKCESYDWEHSVWAKLAAKCLGCGACAFLCPTCHCFDMMECARGSKGSRYRCWDTCQFEKFTLMGAGHNPRPSKTERTRQRVFHKFKYSPERYGMLGCVGCGRCIAVCPVNIDIHEVVKELEA
jgi:sulfhydrogenase subunit beta (sulfur reductase)